MKMILHISILGKTKRDIFLTHCIHDCSGYGMGHAWFTEDDISQAYFNTFSAKINNSGWKSMHKQNRTRSDCPQEQSDQGLFVCYVSNHLLITY